MNHLVLISERAQWEVLENYTEHFHHERPHQGLENKITAPQFQVQEPTESVGRRKRLGGLLQYYYPKEVKAA